MPDKENDTTPIDIDEELVDCTCDHDEIEHDYTGCTLCDCPGHWEEYEVTDE